MTAIARTGADGHKYPLQKSHSYFFVRLGVLENACITSVQYWSRYCTTCKCRCVGDGTRSNGLKWEKVSCLQRCCKDLEVLRRHCMWSCRRFFQRAMQGLPDLLGVSDYYHCTKSCDRCKYSTTRADHLTKHINSCLSQNVWPTFIL